MQREFPNKPGETLAVPADIGSPQNLHPAFYGCFDWHSSVHGHWMLVKLLKTFPGLKDRDLIRGKLAENISAENILAEVEYFQRTRGKLVRADLRLGLAAEARRGAAHFRRSAGPGAGEQPAAADRPGRAAVSGIPAEAALSRSASANTAIPPSASASPGIMRMRLGNRELQGSH